MSEETPSGNGDRTLDRRGFLGAAAGVVATAGAVSAPFTFGAMSASSATCTETTSSIPKARRGAIHYSFNASAWNTQALFETDSLPLMKHDQLQRLGVRGQLPDVRPGITGNTAPAGWVPFGSYAKKYGFRIVGTHDGPNPTSAANLGSAHSRR